MCSFCTQHCSQENPRRGDSLIEVVPTDLSTVNTDNRAFVRRETDELGKALGGTMAAMDLEAAVVAYALQQDWRRAPLVVRSAHRRNYDLQTRRRHWKCRVNTTQCRQAQKRKLCVSQLLNAWQTLWCRSDPNYLRISSRKARTAQIIEATPPRTSKTMILVFTMKRWRFKGFLGHSGRKSNCS